MSIAQTLPFPGPFQFGVKTYAPAPVWRDSTTTDVKFHPLPKRQAVKLWHFARDFERRTRQPGHQDGIIGRNGLAVLHALIFDFLNYATGRLEPGYAAIARLANISERSVARGLQALKAAGVLNWVRRCATIMRDGRFSLEQETNAYAILPATQWHGYDPPPPAPPPLPDTWGDHPCGMRSGMEEASAEYRHGGGTMAAIRQLALDTGDPVAQALARLGRTMFDNEARGAQSG